jgi:hypothetical protein
VIISVTFVASWMIYIILPSWSSTGVWLGSQ